MRYQLWSITRLTYHTCIKVRSYFKKRRNQKFGPELAYRSTSGRLSVDWGLQGRSSTGRLPVDRTKCVSSRFGRSTAGRLGLQLAVACRSTAGRPIQGRNLGYLERSTGWWTGRPPTQNCARLCTSVDCPPWAGRPKFWNMLLFGQKSRFLWWLFWFVKNMIFMI